MNQENSQYQEFKTRWWEAQSSHYVKCNLCPRHCILSPGKRGFCFVRQNINGEMVLTVYGKNTGLCIDPIEKKPLNNFYPGSTVLSFGTMGCNLACQFCQNWQSSKAELSEEYYKKAKPEEIAGLAFDNGCKSVAFTYNEPIIFAEYAIDTAKYCHEKNIKTVAVTAGFIEKDARKDFFSCMDAANVDLKAFSDDFYRQYTNSRINPVLETLIHIKKETSTWLEITNLLIPGKNDNPEEIKKMCEWILENLGEDVPIHFGAFHPDYKMTDTPPTPLKTIIMAYETACSMGLKYVYTGNVVFEKGDTTFCPKCNEPLIVRNWFDIKKNRLIGNTCCNCKTIVAGRFNI